MPWSDSIVELRKTIVLAMIVSLAVGGTAFAVAAGPGGPGNDGGTDNSEAQITVDFGENCKSFHVESTKDISFVSINNNTTFTYEKFEGEEIKTEDEDFDNDETEGNDTTDFSWSGE